MAPRFAAAHLSAPTAHASFVTPRAPAAAPGPPVTALKPAPVPVPAPVPTPVAPTVAPSPRPAVVGGPGTAIPLLRSAQPTTAGTSIKPYSNTSGLKPRQSVTPDPAKSPIRRAQSRPGVPNGGTPAASNSVSNQSTAPRTVATPQTLTGASIPQRPNGLQANPQPQVPQPGQASGAFNPRSNKPSQATNATPQIRPQAPLAQGGARSASKPNVTGPLRPNPNKTKPTNESTSPEESEGKKTTSGPLTASDKSAIESLFARSPQYTSLHRSYQNLQSQYSGIHPRNPSLPSSHPLLQKLIPIVTQLHSTATQIDNLRNQLSASGASSTPALKKPAARSYIGSFKGVAAIWARTLAKDEALLNQTGPKDNPAENSETMRTGQSKPSQKDNVDWGSVIDNGISTAGQVVGQAIQVDQGQGQNQFGGNSGQPGQDGQQQPMMDTAQDPDQQLPGTDVDQGQTDNGSYAQGDESQGFVDGYDDKGVGQGPDDQAGGYDQGQYGQDHSQYMEQGRGQNQYGRSSGY